MLLLVLLGAASAYLPRRSCRHTRFCRDSLHPLTNFTLHWTTIHLDDRRFRASLSRDDGLPFELIVSQLVSGGFHVPLEPTANETFSRFDCSRESLIVNQTAISRLNRITHNSTPPETLISGTSSESLRIRYDPLVVRFLRNDEVLITMNLDKNLLFESNSNITVANETYDGFTDTIPNGATAVALDFHFAGRRTRLSGLSEHSKHFNLDDTDDPMRLFTVGGFGNYGTVPFVIAHSPTVSCGLFWMNPSDTFASISTGTNSRKLFLLSEGGFIDFVLFSGTGNQIIESFTTLTGKPTFGPLFALGYYQCKWGYRDQMMVEWIIANFTKHSIPFDAMWLDIDHLDGYAPFIVNTRAFPDLAKLYKMLGERALVRITDPHIPVRRHWMSDEGKAKNYFVKDGKSDFVGRCWPGKSSWPNFLDVNVREWWAAQFSAFPRSVHVWNDMNEASVFESSDGTFGKDFIHKNSDGIQFEDREVHSLYGLLNVAATSRGLLNRTGYMYRPFILTRSFFAGSQKFAWTWSGDNRARWMDLRRSVTDVVVSGLNGMPFTGADVGGFFGNVTEELLVRWYQVGAWCYPFFREHADSRSSYREPHLYNSTILGMIRSAIHDRYRILPTWYTAAYFASVTGEPIVKPLWLEFPDVEALHDCESQVIVANALLVVPEMSNAAWPLTVVKPPGIWYHFVNGTLLVESVNTTVPIDEIMVYIHGGRIVASWSKVGGSTKETVKSSLVLHIALDERNEAQGLLYLDDGETYKYIRGEYLEKQFTIRGSVLTAASVDLDTKVPSKFIGTKI
jgi:alpha 1,3-glucosidase